jgi:hypothetical protein
MGKGASQKTWEYATVKGTKTLWHYGITANRRLQDSMTARLQD